MGPSHVCPVFRGRFQGSSLSVPTPPVKCKDHFIDITMAREKQIRTKDSIRPSGIPANAIVLHIYVLIQWVLVSHVLRVFYLLLLEELLRAREKDACFSLSACLSCFGTLGYKPS